MPHRAVIDITVFLVVFLGVTGILTALRRGLPVGRRLVSALQAVMEPHRRGDYEAALQATEGLRFRGEVTSQYCYFRGANLALLGRLDEAEVWLRRNIEMQKGTEKRLLAVAYTTLGQVLLQAERYDEARKCFETSMQYFPGRGSGYRSMAEMYLLRGDNPAEALRWAELAVEREKADRGMTTEIRKLNLGEDLATLAWSTAAATHDRSEVTRLVSEAVDSVGTSNVQSTALVQYQSGRAYTEVGDTQASTKHYQEAARIDPQGHWGRAARKALEVRQSV